MRNNTVKNLGIVLVSVLILAAVITLIEMASFDVRLWLSYAILLLIGSGIIYLGWLAVRGEEAPRKLLLIVLAGLSLRLAVGVALYQGLPRWGYDEKAQRAGYVYWDAFKRDKDAYAIAKSDQPILQVFTSDVISDQYGGLLALSAFIYRYSPADGHHPLSVVIPLASISVLAILFTWGFARRTFGAKIAIGSAWVIALYPEAILLGASQMREPFLIASLALALFGYSCLGSEKRRLGVVYLAISVLILGLPVSPPFIAVAMGTIFLLWIWQARRVSRNQILGFVFVLLIAIAAVFLTARAWADFQGIGGSTLDILQGWLENATSQWRLNLVSEQSALLDSLLDRLPTALELPFLVLYGVIQPFLPAAIIAPGASIWKVIGIWRSLGWAVILPVLIYATIRAPHKAGWHSLMTFFVGYIWVTALLSSYRAPSYQWDSPRYRAAFISIQAIAAAWAWHMAKDDRDRWLSRLYIVFGILFGMFTVWYVGRYTDGFLLSINATMLIAMGLSLAYLIVMVVKDRRVSVGVKDSE
jgi:hypothetical protein